MLIEYHILHPLFKIFWSTCKSISKSLQITADEAIFSLVMMLQHKEFSNSKSNTQYKDTHKGRRGALRSNSFSGSVMNSDSKDSIDVAISQAYQRLLAHQADDGSFSYTKWENR